MAFRRWGRQWGCQWSCQWSCQWGDGTPCPDVFAADDAKRKHESLKAKAATLQQVSSGAAGSGATRERTRSPRA